MDLGLLILGVQNYGVQEVVDQIISDFTSYLSTIGVNPMSPHAHGECSRSAVSFITLVVYEGVSSRCYQGYYCKHPVLTYPLLRSVQYLH